MEVLLVSKAIISGNPVRQTQPTTLILTIKPPQIKPLGSQPRSMLALWDQKDWRKAFVRENNGQSSDKFAQDNFKECQAVHINSTSTLGIVWRNLTTLGTNRTHDIVKCKLKQ